MMANILPDLKESEKPAIKDLLIKSVNTLDAMVHAKNDNSLDALEVLDSMLTNLELGKSKNEIVKILKWAASEPHSDPLKKPNISQRAIRILASHFYLQHFSQKDTLSGTEQLALEPFKKPYVIAALIKATETDVIQEKIKALQDVGSILVAIDNLKEKTKVFDPSVQKGNLVNCLVEALGSENPRINNAASIELGRIIEALSHRASERGEESEALGLISEKIYTKCTDILKDPVNAAAIFSKVARFIKLIPKNSEYSKKFLAIIQKMISASESTELVKKIGLEAFIEYIGTLEDFAKLQGKKELIDALEKKGLSRLAYEVIESIPLSEKDYKILNEIVDRVKFPYSMVLLGIIRTSLEKMPDYSSDSSKELLKAFAGLANSRDARTSSDALREFIAYMKKETKATEQTALLLGFLSELNNEALEKFLANKQNITVLFDAFFSSKTEISEPAEKIIIRLLSNDKTAMITLNIIEDRLKELVTHASEADKKKAIDAVKISLQLRKTLQKLPLTKEVIQLDKNTNEIVEHAIHNSAPGIALEAFRTIAALDQKYFEKIIKAEIKALQASIKSGKPDTAIPAIQRIKLLIEIPPDTSQAQHLIELLDILKEAAELSTQPKISREAIIAFDNLSENPKVRDYLQKIISNLQDTILNAESNAESVASALQTLEAVHQFASYEDFISTYLDRLISEAADQNPVLAARAISIADILVASGFEPKDKLTSVYRSAATNLNFQISAIGFNKLLERKEEAEFMTAINALGDKMIAENYKDAVIIITLANQLSSVFPDKAEEFLILAKNAAESAPANVLADIVEALKRRPKILAKIAETEQGLAAIFNNIGALATLANNEPGFRLIQPKIQAMENAANGTDSRDALDAVSFSSRITSTTKDLKLLGIFKHIINIAVDSKSREVRLGSLKALIANDPNYFNEIFQSKLDAINTQITSETTFRDAIDEAILLGEVPLNDGQKEALGRILIAAAYSENPDIASKAFIALAKVHKESFDNLLANLNTQIKENRKSKQEALQAMRLLQNCIAKIGDPHAQDLIAIIVPKTKYRNAEITKLAFQTLAIASHEGIVPAQYELSRALGHLGQKTEMRTLDIIKSILPELMPDKLNGEMQQALKIVRQMAGLKSKSLSDISGEAIRILIEHDDDKGLSDLMNDLPSRIKKASRTDATDDKISEGLQAINSLFILLSYKGLKQKALNALKEAARSLQPEISRAAIMALDTLHEDINANPSLRDAISNLKGIIEDRKSEAENVASALLALAAVKKFTSFDAYLSESLNRISLEARGSDVTLAVRAVKIAESLEKHSGQGEKLTAIFQSAATNINSDISKMGFRNLLKDDRQFNIAVSSLSDKMTQGSYMNAEPILALAAELSEEFRDERHKSKFIALIADAARFAPPSVALDAFKRLGDLKQNDEITAILQEMQEISTTTNTREANDAIRAISIASQLAVSSPEHLKHCIGILINGMKSKVPTIAAACRNTFDAEILNNASVLSTITASEQGMELLRLRVSKLKDDAASSVTSLARNAVQIACEVRNLDLDPNLKNLFKDIVDAAVINIYPEVRIECLKALSDYDRKYFEEVIAAKILAIERQIKTDDKKATSDAINDATLLLKAPINSADRENLVRILMDAFKNSKSSYLRSQTLPALVDSGRTAEVLEILKNGITSSNPDVANTALQTLEFAVRQNVPGAVDILNSHKQQLQQDLEARESLARNIENLKAIIEDQNSDADSVARALVSLSDLYSIKLYDSYLIDTALRLKGLAGGNAPGAKSEDAEFALNVVEKLINTSFDSKYILQILNAAAHHANSGIAVNGLVLLQQYFHEQGFQPAFDRLVNLALSSDEREGANALDIIRQVIDRLPIEKEQYFNTLKNTALNANVTVAMRALQTLALVYGGEVFLTAAIQGIINNSFSVEQNVALPAQEKLTSLLENSVLRKFVIEKMLTAIIEKPEALTAVINAGKKHSGLLQEIAKNGYIHEIFENPTALLTFASTDEGLDLIRQCIPTPDNMAKESNLQDAINDMQSLLELRARVVYADNTALLRMIEASIEAGIANQHPEIAVACLKAVQNKDEIYFNSIFITKINAMRSLLIGDVDEVAAISSIDFATSMTTELTLSSPQIQSITTLLGEATHSKNTNIAVNSYSALFSVDSDAYTAAITHFETEIYPKPVEKPDAAATRENAIDILFKLINAIPDDIGRFQNIFTNLLEISDVNLARKIVERALADNIPSEVRDKIIHAAITNPDIKIAVECLEVVARKDLVYFKQLIDKRITELQLLMGKEERTALATITNIAFIYSKLSGYLDEQQKGQIYNIAYAAAINSFSVKVALEGISILRNAPMQLDLALDKIMASAASEDSDESHLAQEKLIAFLQLNDKELTNKIISLATEKINVAVTKSSKDAGYDAALRAGESNLRLLGLFLTTFSGSKTLEPELKLAIQAMRTALLQPENADIKDRALDALLGTEPVPLQSLAFEALLNVPRNDRTDHEIFKIFHDLIEPACNNISRAVSSVDDKHIDEDKKEGFIINGLKSIVAIRKIIPKLAEKSYTSKKLRDDTFNSLIEAATCGEPRLYKAALIALQKLKDARIEGAEEAIEKALKNLVTIADDKEKEINALSALGFAAGKKIGNAETLFNNFLEALKKDVAPGSDTEKALHAIKLAGELYGRKVIQAKDSLSILVTATAHKNPEVAMEGLMRLAKIKNAGKELEEAIRAIIADAVSSDAERSGPAKDKLEAIFRDKTLAAFTWKVIDEFIKVPINRNNALINIMLSALVDPAAIEITQSLGKEVLIHFASQSSDDAKKIIDQLFAYLQEGKKDRVELAITLLTDLKNIANKDIQADISSYIKEKLTLPDNMNALFNAVEISDTVVIPFIKTLATETFTAEIIFDKFEKLHGSKQHDLIHKLSEVIVSAANHPIDPSHPDTKSISHMGRRALIKGIASEHDGLNAIFLGEVLKHASTDATAQSTIELISGHEAHHHPKLIHAVLKPIAQGGAAISDTTSKHAYKAIITGIASKQGKFEKADHTFSHAAHLSLEELALTNPELTINAIIDNFKDEHLEGSHLTSLLDVMMSAAKISSVESAKNVINHLLNIAINPSISINDKVAGSDRTQVLVKAKNGLIELLKTQHKLVLAAIASNDPSDDTQAKTLMEILSAGFRVSGKAKIWEDTALALIDIATMSLSPTDLVLQKYSDIARQLILDQILDPANAKATLELISKDPVKGKQLIDLIEKAAKEGSVSVKRLAFEHLIRATGSDNSDFRDAAFAKLESLAKERKHAKETFSAIIKSITNGVAKKENFSSLLNIIYDTASADIDPKVKAEAFESILSCSLDAHLELYNFGILAADSLINTQEDVVRVLNSTKNIQFISRLVEICSKPAAYDEGIQTAAKNILSKILAADLNEDRVKILASAASPDMISFIRTMEMPDDKTRNNVVNLLVSIISSKKELIPNAVTALYELGELRALFENRQAIMAASASSDENVINFLTGEIINLEAEASINDTETAQNAVWLAASLWKAINPRYKPQLEKVVAAGIDNDSPDVALACLLVLANANSELFNKSIQDLIASAISPDPTKSTKAIPILQACLANKDLREAVIINLTNSLKDIITKINKAAAEGASDAELREGEKALNAVQNIYELLPTDLPERGELRQALRSAILSKTAKFAEQVVQTIKSIDEKIFFDILSDARIESDDAAKCLAVVYRVTQPDIALFIRLIATLNSFVSGDNIPLATRGVKIANELLQKLPDQSKEIIPVILKGGIHVNDAVFKPARDILSNLLAKHEQAKIIYELIYNTTDARYITILKTIALASTINTVQANTAKIFISIILSDDAPLQTDALKALFVLLNNDNTHAETLSAIAIASSVNLAKIIEKYKSDAGALLLLSKNPTCLKAIAENPIALRTLVTESLSKIMAGNDADIKTALDTLNYIIQIKGVLALEPPIKSYMTMNGPALLKNMTKSKNEAIAFLMELAKHKEMSKAIFEAIEQSDKDTHYAFFKVIEDVAKLKGPDAEVAQLGRNALIKAAIKGVTVDHKELMSAAILQLKDHATDAETHAEVLDAIHLNTEHNHSSLMDVLEHAALRGSVSVQNRALQAITKSIESEKPEFSAAALTSLGKIAKEKPKATFDAIFAHINVSDKPRHFLSLIDVIKNSTMIPSLQSEAIQYLIAPVLNIAVVKGWRFIGDKCLADLKELVKNPVTYLSVLQEIAKLPHDEQFKLIGVLQAGLESLDNNVWKDTSVALVHAAVSGHKDLGPAAQIALELEVVKPGSAQALLELISDHPDQGKSLMSVFKKAAMMGGEVSTVGFEALITATNSANIDFAAAALKTLAELVVEPGFAKTTFDAIIENIKNGNATAKINDLLELIYNASDNADDKVKMEANAAIMRCATIETHKEIVDFGILAINQRINDSPPRFAAIILANPNCDALINRLIGILAKPEGLSAEVLSAAANILGKIVNNLNLSDPVHLGRAINILRGIKGIAFEGDRSAEVKEQIDKFYSFVVNNPNLHGMTISADPATAVGVGVIANELLVHRVNDADRNVLFGIITQVLLHQDSRIAIEFISKIAVANNGAQSLIFSGLVARLQSMVAYPVGVPMDAAKVAAAKTAVNRAHALLVAGKSLAGLGLEPYKLIDVIRAAGFSENTEIRNHGIKVIINLITDSDANLSGNGRLLAASVLAKYHPESPEATTLIKPHLLSDQVIDHYISVIKGLTADAIKANVHIPFLAALGSICNHLTISDPRYLKIVNFLAQVPTFALVVNYLSNGLNLPQAINVMAHVIQYRAYTPQRKDDINKFLAAINQLENLNPADNLIPDALYSLSSILERGKPDLAEIGIILDFYKDFMVKRMASDPTNSILAAFHLARAMPILAFNTPSNYELDVLTALSDYLTKIRKIDDGNARTSATIIQQMATAVNRIPRNLDPKKAAFLIAELSKVVTLHHATEHEMVNKAVEELRVALEKFKLRTGLELKPPAPLPPVLPPGPVLSVPVDDNPALVPPVKPPKLMVSSGTPWSPLFRERIRNQVGQPNPTLVVPSAGPISDVSFKAIGDAIATKIKDYQTSATPLSMASSKEEKEMFEGLEIIPDNKDTPKSYEIVRNTTSAHHFKVQEKLIKIDHDDRSVRIASETPYPKDDALFMMVLSAKAAADRVGKKIFNIEQCEDPIHAANAFRLFLLGKSMGLNANFKDRSGMPKTEAGILDTTSEFGMTIFNVTINGAAQQMTPAAIYDYVKRLDVDNPIHMQEIKNVVKSMQVQAEKLELIRDPKAPKL